MMHKNLYLCGPITSLSYGDCTNWRVAAKQYMDVLSDKRISTFSPLRFTKNEDIAKSDCIGHSYDNTVHSNQCAIATRDRIDVLTCDLMLINFLGSKVVSKNSLVELGLAASDVKKYVVCLIEQGNIHHGPLIDEFCQYVVEPKQDESINDCLIRGLHVCYELLMPD